MTTVRRAVRRHLLVIGLLVVVATGVGYKTGPVVSPLYHAKSVVWINMPEAEFNTQNQRVNSVLNLTMSDIVRSVAFVNLIVADAHVPRSPYGELGAITAAPDVPSLLIDVQVIDADPTIAVRLANAAPQAFKQEIVNLGGQPPAINLVVPAQATRQTQGHRKETNAATAAAFGLVAGVGAALLLEYLDLTLTTAGEAERLLGLPVLAATAERPAFRARPSPQPSRSP